MLRRSTHWRAGGELDSEEELTSSGYLHRWLRARDYNVGVTLQLIKRHSAWRVRNMPKGYVDEVGANDGACSALR